MHSLYPCIDPELWLRWAVGVAVVWWLPGFLLTQRLVRGWPRLFQLYVALAVGLVWTTGIGHTLGVLGAAMPLWIYLPISVGTALSLRLLLQPPRVERPWSPDPSPHWVWLSVACLLLAAGHIYGFRELVAPPHVHDASNHAFLVWRIDAAGSMNPRHIFAPGVPVPTEPYFAGWHFAAALTGAVSGLAPYVATWFTALSVTILLPLALGFLWARWKVPALAAVVASLWVGTNAFLPTSLYSWGGFGQLVGFFLLPVGVYIVCEMRRASGPGMALAGGALLAMLVHIHFSEVVVVLILAGLTLAVDSITGQAPLPSATNVAPTRRWLQASLFTLGFALAIDPDMIRAITEYRAVMEVKERDHPLISPFDAAWRWVMSIGKPDLRAIVVIPSFAWVLFTRRWRVLAVASLVFGIWYMMLAVVGDPVSRALATPFYRAHPRVLYQQIFFVPLFVGLASAGLLAVTRWRRAVPALVVVASIYMFAAGFKREASSLSSHDASVPFSNSEYELALQMRQVVGRGDVVANLRDDGSTWAMHVSGVPFLIPMSWACTTADDLRLFSAVAGFRAERWGQSTLRLRELGVQYLYVSSIRLNDSPDLLDPGDFAGDPRFETVLESGDAQLLRILWDAPQDLESSDAEAG